VGEWNAEEIIVRGRRVMVILNGTTIVDAELDQASAAGTIDDRDHPGLKRATGHISFCGHGSRVEFRNLRIKKYGSLSFRVGKSFGIRVRPERDEGLPLRRRSSRLPASDAEVSETIKANLKSTSW
jgi:hypothetical protein